VSERREVLNQMLDDEAGRWRERTPISWELLIRRARHLPSGVASSIQSHYPYPLTISHGQGAYVTDVDGNSYLDLHSGFGVNIAGHRHPAIVRAQEEQIQRGVHFAYPTAELGDYSQELCERFGMDQVRLCNSGTESTADAIRLARAATGRDRILKFEGAYHGHHDTVLGSIKPDIEAAGPSTRPNTVASGGGIPEQVRELVTVAPFNAPEVLDRLLSEHEHACVLMEPVMCNLGLTMPDPGYLDTVRDLCDRHGALLIFDQVKTGMGIAWGGAVDLFGVQPDIQCLGKGIGGGIPIAAFGGRLDLMRLVRDGAVAHYGTFNGNPLAVVSGLAALRVLDRGAWARIEHAGQAIYDGLQTIAATNELPVHTARVGAKGGMFFSPSPTRNYRDWFAHTDHLLAQVHQVWMANRGVLMAPGGDEQWTVSLAVDQAACDRLLSLEARFARLVARLPDC
jgi:glutamate-1-semialdehyde 2,1-aminomutase